MTGHKSTSCRNSYCRWSLCLSLVVMTGFPFLSAYAMEGKAFNDFMKSFDKSRREDATAAIATARQFAQNNELTPAQVSLLYSTIANVQQNTLKDAAAALVTLEEGLQKLTANGERFRLIGQKTNILTATGRAGEAEALLREQWPEINKTSWYATVLPTYINTLQKVGKHDTALQVTQALVEERLETLVGKPELFHLLIDQLLASGRPEDAAGWGKLYLMVCPFDERSLQASLQMLSRIWSVEHVAPAKVQELLEAQQDPDKPSPLQNVKLPSLDLTGLRKRLETVRHPDERFVLQLLLGEHQNAMTQARRLMLDKPDSPAGVLLVCRVFKARDLKLKRANAFLEFYKTGQGVNPLTEFQQETQQPGSKQ